MSIAIVRAVRAIDLPGVDKAILVAYAEHASDDGTRSFPSVEMLVWETGFSERTVRDVIGRLVSEGLLISETSTTGGRGVVPVYTVCPTAKPARKFTKKGAVPAVPTSEKGAVPAEKDGVNQAERVQFPPKKGAVPAVKSAVPNKVPVSNRPGNSKRVPTNVGESKPPKEPSPPSSAIGYFLAKSKESLGRCATLPNAKAAGAQAKSIAIKAGKEDFALAVDAFFTDPWYAEQYGGSWDDFRYKFEKILARAKTAAKGGSVARGSPGSGYQNGSSGNGSGNGSAGGVHREATPSYHQPFKVPV